MSDVVFDYTPAPTQITVWEAALGLRGSSNLELLNEVRAGLPADVFNRFADVAGVSRDDLAGAVHVSLRTVQRRADAGANLDLGPSERLVRLADLYARAARVVGDDGLARQWMQTPREVFGDWTPFELAGSELGAREVEDLLLRVEHGVFY